MTKVSARKVQNQGDYRAPADGHKDKRVRPLYDGRPYWVRAVMVPVNIGSFIAWADRVMSVTAGILTGSRRDTSSCSYVWSDRLPLGRPPPSALEFFVSIDLSDSQSRLTSRS